MTLVLMREIHKYMGIANMFAFGNLRNKVASKKWIQITTGSGCGFNTYNVAGVSRRQYQNVTNL